MIKVGDMAPDFTLKGHDDREHRLSDYRGEKVVLAFYPADFSPTCTDQHVCLRDDAAAFRKAGARVFGISVDSRWSHKAWAEKLGLDYTLLSDFNPRGAVATQYGVFHPDYGIAGRATFVIGPDGRVAAVMNYDFPEVPKTAPVIEALNTI